MSRVGARFVLPILAAAGLWFGANTNASGQNAPDNDNGRDAAGRLTNPSRALSRGPHKLISKAKPIRTMRSTARTDSAYSAVFTHIHGPEQTDDPLKMLLALQHLVGLEIAFDNKKSVSGFHRIGNTTHAINRDSLRHILRKTIATPSNLYNILACFHGIGAHDTKRFAAQNKTYVGGHLLHNANADSDSSAFLLDYELVSELTDAVWDDMTPHDQFNIVWASCQGGAAARAMGGMPPNSRVLVESDAFHDVWLNFDSFNDAYRPDKIHWKPIAPSQFIEGRLFFQNSMEHDIDSVWNEHPLAFFTTRDRAQRPPVVMGTDTVAVAPRRAHVLDFERVTPALYATFGADTLKKAAEKYTDFIETAVMVKAVSVADTRTQNPHYKVPEKSYFDKNLADITIRKLARVKDHADFMKKLNDPERKFARILAFALYSAPHNAATLETVEDYITRKHFYAAGPQTR